MMDDKIMLVVGLSIIICQLKYKICYEIVMLVAIFTYRALYLSVWIIRLDNILQN